MLEHAESIAADAKLTADIHIEYILYLYQGMVTLHLRSANIHFVSHSVLLKSTQWTNSSMCFTLCCHLQLALMDWEVCSTLFKFSSFIIVLYNIILPDYTLASLSHSVCSVWFLLSIFIYYLYQSCAIICFVHWVWGKFVYVNVMWPYIL